MKQGVAAVAGGLLAVLLADCTAVPAPHLAKSAADCNEAHACEVRGLLTMSSDGHGFIGIVRLDDGSCINVSIPDSRSRSLLGKPAQAVDLVGTVMPFPYGADILYFTVNGRKVGFGLCTDYYVFVK
jgi:hypothetical protein